MQFRCYDEAWTTVQPLLQRFGQEVQARLRRALDQHHGTDGFRLEVRDLELADLEKNGYNLGVQVHRGDQLDEDLSVDIQIELIDAADHDGFSPEDPEWGVNLDVGICSLGGEFLGGLVPYNYTHEVWTRDSDELTRRVVLLDPWRLVAVVLDHLRTEIYLTEAPEDILENLSNQMED